MTRAGTLLGAVLDQVFPPRCVGCKAFGSYFCAECLALAPRVDGQRCARCQARGFTDSCLPCYQHPTAYRSQRSAFLYAEEARKAVLALKFGGVSAAAPAMAAPMADLLVRWGRPVSVVVSVPLGGIRKRTRGYNQAELLARGVADLVGLPYDGKLLKRSRNTPPQTGQDDAMARRRNLRGAFVADPRRIPGVVLLVDDVTTTGATLDACARALRDAGAPDVYCLTFARED